MPWDSNKDTGDELTSDEWDNHVSDQKNHSGRHEDGGSDELDVSNLSGVLADAQTPQTEAVEDIVDGLLSGGTNITLTYDDNNDVLTIDTSALNTEEVEDAVSSLITAGNAITVNYDDANDSLSIAVDESSLSFYDGTNLTADVDNSAVTTEDLDIGSQDFVKTGDLLPIFSSKFDPQGFTTSATSYEYVTDVDSRIRAALNTVPSDKAIKLGWTGSLLCDTAGETAFARLGYVGNTHPGTEITVSGNDFVNFESELVEITEDLQDSGDIRIQMRVSDGAATAEVQGSAVATAWVQL